MAPLLRNRSSQKENGLLRYVSREVAIASAAFRLSDDVVEPFACEVSSPIATLFIITRSKGNWKFRDAGREQHGDMQNEKKIKLEIY
jgi:hypothetical protein